MFLLSLGIVLFALPHFFSSLLPGPRDRILARFGEGPFKGLYSAVTGLGFILIAVAYFLTRGSGAMLYAPAGNLKHATLGLATIGIILIAASHGKGHLRLWLRNPMSIGIALWSIGHLLSVGKTAADWFWFTLLAVALLDIVVSMARGKKPNYQANWNSDIKALVISLVLTAVLVFLFHPYVLGVKVVG